MQKDDWWIQYKAEDGQMRTPRTEPEYEEMRDELRRRAKEAADAYYKFDHLRSEIQVWTSDRTWRGGPPEDPSPFDRFSLEQFRWVFSRPRSTFDPVREMVLDNEPRWVQDIQAERSRQDQEWGGPAHDDQHEVTDWLEYIGKQHGRAFRASGPDEARERFVKIAALAAAAVERLDRQADRRPRAMSSRACKGRP